MEDPEDCRICEEPGQYNIFNDELCFDAKNTNKLKIYIVLNNFLFEKLYSQDEHSSFICHTCCNSLCDSYTFMTGVRKSEQNQRLGIPKSGKKLLKIFLPAEETNLKIEALEFMDEQAVDEKEESILEEDVATPEEVHENEEFELKAVEKVATEIVRLESFQKVVVQPSAKRSKSSATGLPDSIMYTHYELVTTDENDQNVVVLNVSAQRQKLPKEGRYEFDTSWIDHRADAATIYKCQYCIKAFSSADFLLKHTLSSHLCLICLEAVENYKELNKHSKVHTSVNCHFCLKKCGSSSNFRQHLKKNHLLQIPNHVGILADSFQFK